MVGGVAQVELVWEDAWSRTLLRSGTLDAGGWLAGLHCQHDDGIEC